MPLIWCEFRVRLAPSHETGRRALLNNVLLLRDAAGPILPLRLLAGCYAVSMQLPTGSVGNACGDVRVEPSRRGARGAAWCSMVEPAHEKPNGDRSRERNSIQQLKFHCRPWTRQPRILPVAAGPGRTGDCSQLSSLGPAFARNIFRPAFPSGPFCSPPVYLIQACRLLGHAVA